MDDLADVVPFVLLALLLLAAVGLVRRGGGRRVPSGRPSVHDRIRVTAICAGVVVLAPTVGYGIGTALSLSPTADSQLAVAATCATLVGTLLWRKLRLRRKIG